MATIRDIAKLAGVSQSTVSNVLNGKKCVSSEKIQQVMAAAKKLDYSINASARQLRSVSGESKNIVILLPNLWQPEYTAFLEGVQDYIQEKGFCISLYITNDLLYTEKAALLSAMSLRPRGIIAIPTNVQDLRVYQNLGIQPNKIIFALRYTRKGTQCVSFPLEEIGKNIASWIKSKGFKKILFCTPAELLFRQFESEMQKYDDIKICYCNGGQQPVLQELFELLRQPFEPDVAICTTEYLEQCVRFACQKGSLSQIPHILRFSCSTRQDFLGMISADDTNSSTYILDYYEVGKQAAIRLLEQERDEPQHIFVPAGGFLVKPPLQITKYKATHLNVLLPSMPISTSLMEITPAFTKNTGIEVNYVIVEPETLYSDISDILHRSCYDIVPVNNVMRSLIPENALSSFNRSFYNQMTQGMFPAIIAQLSHYGIKQQAIPFSAGTRFLIYRKDIFEDSLTKRLYKEQCGKDLNIPTTFDEYNEVARFFTKRLNPISPTEYGSSMAFEARGEICTGFLMRYFSYGGTFIDRGDTYEMTADAVIKALQNLKDLTRLAPTPNNSLQWGNYMNYFLSGNSVMDFSNFAHPFNLWDLNKMKHNGEIGYALMPGETPGVGCWGLSLVASSKNKESATLFISWACGHEQARTLTMLGGTSPYIDIYQDRYILKQYPWYSILEESLKKAYNRTDYSFLDMHKFERILDMILFEYCNNIIDEEEAFCHLRSAVKDCYWRG